jgi:UDP-N-acetylglucosamine:LPS N-acetylglucosamine transferase
MHAIAQWVRDAQPEAFVVDISVEVAAFVRLLGVPVIVTALPGTRTDGPHHMVHQLADHIIAAWPKELAEPEWLRPHAAKTSYVGGISRYEGRQIPEQRRSAHQSTSARGVLVLGGAEGIGAHAKVVEDQHRQILHTQWTFMGASGTNWTADPWPHICAADVVVTHAGQGCIADVAAAQRPAVVIPQPRPFDEQRTTAAVLRRAGLAAVTEHWPRMEEWPALLERAHSSDPSQWRRWRVDGAADRAAAAIEATARRHGDRVTS